MNCQHHIKEFMKLGLNMDVWTKSLCTSYQRFTVIFYSFVLKGISNEHLSLVYIVIWKKMNINKMLLTTDLIKIADLLIQATSTIIKSARKHTFSFTRAMSPLFIRLKTVFWFLNGIGKLKVGQISIAKRNKDDIRWNWRNAMRFTIFAASKLRQTVYIEIV